MNRSDKEMLDGFLVVDSMDDFKRTKEAYNSLDISPVFFS